MLTARQKGILALCTTFILWGIGAPISKLALHHISWSTFIFFRLYLSLLILSPLVFKKAHKAHISPSSMFIIIILGFLGITFNIGFYFWGLSFTTVIDSSVIAATTSVFTAAAAYFILKEKIKKFVFWGIILSFIGTIIIIIQPILENGLFHLENILGNIFILLATLAWVFYTILQKESKLKIDNLIITYFSFFVGAVTFFPLAFSDLYNYQFYINLTPLLIFAILYETIFATIFAYSLFNYGVKLIEATTAGVISYLHPIVAIFASIIFLGENITLPFILGTFFIIAGLFLAEIRHPKHPLHHWHK